MIIPEFKAKYSHVKAYFVHNLGVDIILIGQAGQMVRLFYSKVNKTVKKERQTGNWRVMCKDKIILGYRRYK